MTRKLPLMPNPDKVPACYFTKLDGNYLLTNDCGYHAFLEPRDFARFVNGNLKEGEVLRSDLESRGFIMDHLDFDEMSRVCRKTNLMDWKGPNVHVVAVTLRCNFKCGYCSSSARGIGEGRCDMTPETAKRVVDFIFATPSPELMIELQGGEPLLNWPVAKFVIDYARKKNESEKRKLHFSLISNFTFMNRPKLEFLISRGVSLCTSLDGPEFLHNKNRAGHKDVIYWLGTIRRLIKRGAPLEAPNAVCTVTRRSLACPEEIVNEFVRLGLERVQLGPLDPIGSAAGRWDEIGYTGKDFVNFYSRALDHIIRLNLKGRRVYEKGARIFLHRILKRERWRYPNIDALCRLAYDFNGDIYPCDEGRLLAEGGDNFFKMGNVRRDTYEKVLEHPAARMSFMTMSPEFQPFCSRCAFNPFCGISPTCHYAGQKNPWGHMPGSYRCEIYRGVFEILFCKLQNPRESRILKSWVGIT